MSVKSRKIERKTVNNITVDRNLCKITINNVKPGNTQKIIRFLAANGIIFNNMETFAGGESESISFSAPEADSRRAACVLEAYKSDCCFEILTEKNLAMLSVIGSGAAYDTGIAAMCYDTLLKQNVEVHLLSLSEMKISALVGEHAVDRAAACLRARYIEAGVYGPLERTVKSHEKEEDFHRLGGSGDYSFYNGRDRFRLVQENNRLSAGKQYKGDNSMRYHRGSADAYGL